MNPKTRLRLLALEGSRLDCLLFIFVRILTERANIEIYSRPYEPDELFPRYIAINELIHTATNKVIREQPDYPLKSISNEQLCAFLRSAAAQNGQVELMDDTLKAALDEFDALVGPEVANNPGP